MTFAEKKEKEGIDCSSRKIQNYSKKNSWMPRISMRIMSRSTTQCLSELRNQPSDKENFAYHYSNILGNAYSFEAGLHLKNAFYREGSSIVARDWQRNVVDRGLEVIQESLKALTITEERTLKPKSYMKIEGVMHREHRRKIASSNRKQ